MIPPLHRCFAFMVSVLVLVIHNKSLAELSRIFTKTLQFRLFLKSIERKKSPQTSTKIECLWAVKYLTIFRKSFHLARRSFQAQRIECDESCGIILVVGLFLSAFHGGNGFGIQRMRRTTTGIHDVAFV